jgi:hypothetical protein
MAAIWPLPSGVEQRYETAQPACAVDTTARIYIERRENCIMLAVVLRFIDVCKIVLELIMIYEIEWSINEVLPFFNSSGGKKGLLL